MKSGNEHWIFSSCRWTTEGHSHGGLRRSGDAVLATDLAMVLHGRIEDLHCQNPTDLGVQLRGF